MLWVELCPSKIHKLKPSLPGPESMAVCRGRTLREVIKVRPSSWALTQSEWYPQVRRKRRHRVTPGSHTHTEEPGEGPGEGVRPRAEERGLSGNPAG